VYFINNNINMARFLTIILIIFLPFKHSMVHAWSEHPLLARPALKGLEMWNNIDSVKVKSLNQFLLETEDSLSLFLAQYETWALSSFDGYMPRPDALEFIPGTDQDQIVARFFNAIRINPGSKVALYLYLAPGQFPGNRKPASFNDLTTLQRVGKSNSEMYVWINEGDLVHPLDVVTTANNEPDYGLDLGLFEDNTTEYGKKFGFGNQPFGNPNLDYSSQAPFHMSFYHEAKILYRFAPSLNHTFLEQRVQQFRDLAAFAFKHDQPYWGWRFLGWSMHYATDATMPYHSKPLPGYSVLRLLWINLKATLGFKSARNNAIQLVSNKHTVIEAYQGQELRRAYSENINDHPFFIALQSDNETPAFSHSFIRERVSKNAVDDSRNFDKTIKQNFPPNMVVDPSVEVAELPELSNLISLIQKEGGVQSTDEINNVIARRLRDYTMTIRSLLFSVIGDNLNVKGTIHDNTSFSAKKVQLN
jgi:hypothetical protein